MQKLNFRKIFLYLLITSVAICALLGIGVILVGNFGELETKVLLTTLTIILTSVLGLACGTNLEAKRGSLVPIAGIVLTILSAILWLFLIWAEHWDGYFFPRVLMSTTLLAVALAHLSLISMAKLDKKFKWALAAVYISVAALVGVILSLIWIENVDDYDFVMRSLGVLSIIVGALTIVLPVFHKLSDNAAEETIIDAEIENLKNRLSALEERKKELLRDESKDAL